MLHPFYSTYSTLTHCTHSTPTSLHLLYSHPLHSHTPSQEVKGLVSQAYETASNVLSSNREELERVAAALLDREVVNYKDLVELIGPMKYKKRIQQHSELAEIWTSRYSHN